MESNSKNSYNHFFYKFRSLDKELAEKVKCVLKGCQTLAKYSVSLLNSNNSSNNNNINSKKIVRYLCSNHIENWETIKVNLIEDKFTD
jgi:hypothetical protein